MPMQVITSDDYTVYNRQNLLDVGVRRKLNNMKHTLSSVFRFTSENPLYAQNWSSSGKYVPALITLTYQGNHQWRAHQITDFIKKLRMHAARKMGIKLRYAWVAETQSRGTIHYHIVCWHPRNKKFPKPSEAGWWSYGRSKIEGVRKGVYTYMQKYITKGCGDGGLGLYHNTKSGRRTKARIFGYGGLNKREREILTYTKVPMYIKKLFGAIPWGESIRRITGGWKCGTTEVMGNWAIYQNPDKDKWYYEFGARWSPVDLTRDNIYIPF